MIYLTVALVAQALDAATWAALPPDSEANPLIQHLHSPQGWALKALLVVAVMALSYALPRMKPTRGWPFDVTWSRSPAACRVLAEVLVVVAIVAGAAGFGANLSVLVG